MVLRKKNISIHAFNSASIGQCMASKYRPMNRWHFACTTTSSSKCATINISVWRCILLFTFFDFSFVAFPSVLWHWCVGLLTCKNRLPYNLYRYCVGGDVKHWVFYNTAQSNPMMCDVTANVRRWNNSYKSGSVREEQVINHHCFFQPIIATENGGSLNFYFFQPLIFSTQL